MIFPPAWAGMPFSVNRAGSRQGGLAMPRFLIEVPHEDEHAACIKALDALEKYGSHFVTRADFGCEDGVHSGWLVVDLDNRAEALQIVPPQFRRDARVVQLSQYTREKIVAMMKELEG
jgi:hypothetical protein